MLTRSIRPRLLMLLLVVGQGAWLLGGCTTNPATGRRQFDLIGRQREIAIGEEAKREIAAQYGGPVDDPYMQSYVRGVGLSLVEHVEGDYGELPWEFTVLDSDVINAFALPGGKVFITRGLVVRLDDEAMLAGVLGHEIGHVTAEHADKQLSEKLAFSIGLAGAAVAAGSSDSDWVRAGVPLLVGVGGSGFLLKFSRNDELEADALGMRYMARAGYDPRALRDVMIVLEDASGRGGREAGGARPPQIFSTHPYPETRIAKIDERLAREYPPEARTGLVRNPERFRTQALSRLPAPE
ncbi:MAG: hypothetical protein D6693_07050 [Planctomycetota bacterium]|nr:MAG: hypothetical protein D6693_07050 [Planctomycetota bacterium]